MTQEIQHFDVAIVGAGIAGASLAYQLAPTHRVLLLESETQPGYHTTGRSAALFCASYGNLTIRRLTEASRGFFDTPPAVFTPVPLLTARGTLLVGRPDQAQRVESLAGELATQGSAAVLVNGDFAQEVIPLLWPESVTSAIYEADAMDIDVNALHQGYLRAARAQGAVAQYEAPIEAMDRTGGGWRLRSRDRCWDATTIVNAAGAWSEEVALMAGARPVGLTPMRRTALTVELPAGVDIHDWPAVIDIDEQFYFKPDAGKLLISPADETPSAPCDAQPDELDVAICIDRVQRVLDLPIRRIGHAWAGLRTFAADRIPVVGHDPGCSGFFWLAGQGGYGIQTAPALSALAAWLIAGSPSPAPFADAATLACELSPARFA